MATKQKSTKAPKTEKPKTGRVRKPILERFAATLKKAHDIEAKLVAAGKVNVGDSVSSMMATVDGLKTEGFEFPKTVRGGAKFTTGARVKIKVINAPIYSARYTPDELDSLTFDEFDPIGKIAVLSSVDRPVYAKLAHLEASV